MSSVLTIAAHHLRRLARRPGLVLLLIAVPLTLAGIEYAAFGRSVAAGKLPPVKVLILDEDGSFASRAVPQLFANPSVGDLFTTASVSDRETARHAFERNDAAALVVVPRGFQQAILEGKPAKVVLYKNPIQSIGPEITKGVLETGVLLGNHLYVQAVEPLQQIRVLQLEGRDPTGAEVGHIAGGMFEAGRRLNNLSALQESRVVVQRPRMAAETTRVATRNPADFFAQFFPGLIIFGLLFLSQTLAQGLLRDRTNGLERRLSMMPVSRLALAVGQVVYLAAALLATLAVLMAIGRVLFGIPLRDPLALLAISLGFALFVTGLQLAIGAFAASDRAAGFTSTAIVLILMLAGGTFVPAEQLPPWFQVVPALVPNGAAQEAFVEVLARKHGLAEIGRLLAVTWGWATLLLGVYVYRKRRPAA
jgi:ABC-2 type transport system permease protein